MRRCLVTSVTHAQHTIWGGHYVKSRFLFWLMYWVKFRSEPRLWIPHCRACRLTWRSLRLTHSPIDSASSQMSWFGSLNATATSRAGVQLVLHRGQRMLASMLPFSMARSLLQVVSVSVGDGQLIRRTGSGWLRVASWPSLWSWMISLW